VPALPSAKSLLPFFLYPFFLSFDYLFIYLLFFGALFNPYDSMPKG